MYRNRAIEGTVTGAKFKFLSTKDFPFIVSRTKKIFALEVIFTFISRIDKFPRKMKSSYFITPSCSVSVSSLHFARLGRHIEYSRASGTCVTTRRRSYPFYRQCPCLNAFRIRPKENPPLAFFASTRGRPAYIITKEMIEQLRETGMNWRSMATCLEISEQTLHRHGIEFGVENNFTDITILPQIGRHMELIMMVH